jgi:hypothetical protein
LGPLKSGQTPGSNLSLNIYHILNGPLVFCLFLFFLISLINLFPILRYGLLPFFLVIEFLQISRPEILNSSKFDFLTENSLYTSFYNVFGHLSIIVLPFLFLAFSIKNRTIFPRLGKNTLSEMIILLFAAIPLIGVYPVGDIQHLWWGSLISQMLIIGLALEGLLKYVSPKVFLPLTVSLVISGAAGFMMYAQVPRIVLHDSSIFSGMAIQEKYLPNYQHVAKITETLPPGRVHVNCRDGGFAVWNRTYLANSVNFVNWGWAIEDVSERQLPLFELYCGASEKEALIRANVIGGTLLNRHEDRSMLNGFFDRMAESNFISEFVYLIKL